MRWSSKVGLRFAGATVPTELVVRRDDVGLVSADEPGQAPRRGIDVGRPEVARVEVARPTHHVGVAIAEVLPLGDAEDGHRPLELDRPDLAEPAMVLGRVHVRDDDLAHLAAGAGDEDDAMPGGDGLGHRAAGADRLVVGVGVDGHEGGSVGAARVARRGVVGRGVDGLVGHARDANAARGSRPGSASTSGAGTRRTRDGGDEPLVERRPPPRAWPGGRGRAGRVGPISTSASGCAWRFAPPGRIDVLAGVRGDRRRGPRLPRCSRGRSGAVVRSFARPSAGTSVRSRPREPFGIASRPPDTRETVLSTAQTMRRNQRGGIMPRGYAALPST